MKLAVRSASGVVLLLVLLAVLWLGQPYFDALVALLVGVGLYEYWQLWRTKGWRLDPILLVGLAAFWLFRYAYPQLPDAGVVLILGVLAGLALSLRFDPREQPFLRWSLALAGAAWLGFCPGFLLLLYHGIASRPRALEVLLLTVGVSVIGDTLAYLVGSKFGRHPFVPRISPSKTWEGAVAALVGPTLALGLLLPLVLPVVPTPTAFLIGFVAALAAVVGDLVESQLKREVGVKDSGRLIPGHGGVLDRVDSLIFVGAVVYSLLGVTHAL
ncbi:MAG: phosphatidate cytidylyltransferase [Candidatus Dormibacteria bacterium]